MNTPISFSTAKLLKEKGFDQKSAENGYKISGEESFDFTLDRINGIGIAAPTIAEVCMWLYEVHGIWIDVSLNQFSKPKDLQWMYSIVFTEDCTYSHSPKSFNSPTEAYEAAIEYVLNNLI